MALILANYCQGAAIAVVRHYESQPITELSTPTLLIMDSKATLLPQNVFFEVGDRIDQLQDWLKDGDIVTVSERGMVQKVFDTTEDNATIFITGKCNSNCIMCPSPEASRRNDDGMTDEFMRAYIELLPRDVPHLVVTGGEPTLRTERFLLVMEHLADRLPRSETLLLTNGRSFASKRLLQRMLDHCPSYLMAGIPIHASTPENHDAITQAPGSFWQTLRGIENLMESGVAVELRIVVSRLNLTELDKIATLIIDRLPQVHSVKFMGLEVLGSCARNYDRVYIDPHESWAHIKAPATRLLRAGIPVQLYNYPLCAIDKGYWHICRKSISPHKVRYAPSCSRCEVIDQCGGFFSSTLLRARPAVCPVHFDR